MMDSLNLSNPEQIKGESFNRAETYSLLVSTAFTPPAAGSHQVNLESSSPLQS